MSLQMPETRYAKSGDVAIAYQVVGEGAVDLVWIPGFAQHLELAWEEPNRRAWFERLAQFGRLIIFDKRGTGLSDRVASMGTIEARMDDIRAVLDAVGSERAVVIAVADSGALGIVFAATYPERTAGLVLWTASAATVRMPDLPWLDDRGTVGRRFDEISERWSSPDFWQELIAAGAPSLTSAEERRDLARVIRLSVSPGNMSAYLRANLDIDVRDILPIVHVPTLVVHPTDSVYDVRSGRYIAERIPGARLIELPGLDSIPVVGDREPFASLIADFVDEVASAPPPREPDRVLATVLFTDLIGSTEKAVELGPQWPERLREHNALIRRELARYSGCEIDTAGDGFFASGFDGPARAIRCGCAIRDAIGELGLDVRVGVHTGECELVDGKLAGLAVVIGARVAAQAETGEVLVSGTVKDLVAGSGIEFDPRGARELKGLGEWPLYAVSATV